MWHNDIPLHGGEGPPSKLASKFIRPYEVAPTYWIGRVHIIINLFVIPLEGYDMVFDV
jgi:hypothetical protein